MTTFADYSGAYSVGADPRMLDIVPSDDGFVVHGPEGPLRTPGGKLIMHANEDFANLFVTDLQLGLTGSSLRASSPVLFSFRADFLDDGADPFHDRLEQLLEADPFVRLKTSAESLIEPYAEDNQWFNFSFLQLSGLMAKVNHFAWKVMGELAMEDAESHPFVRLVRFSYERLSADEKVAVQALSSLHGSGVVLPLILTTGEIGGLEYAKTLVALRIGSPDGIPEILGETARILDYLGVVSQTTGRRRSFSALISAGEGDSLEFKSTLRWDIRAAKTNPAIEHACLKTIAAFLNTNGGILLIGVRDDGSVEGIETDRFANEDKFLLHLWTLIRNCMGRDVSPYIRTSTIKSGGKTVCLVDCASSKRPVYLRQAGFGEELFIRVGPSSNALDISEAVKYIDDHFQK
jgi:hypothetical protein